MKTLIETLMVGVLAFGCSSSPELKTAAENAPPAVINPRVSSPVIVLNQELKPAESPDVLADVRGMGSQLEDVQIRLALKPEQSQELKMSSSPFSMPMSHIGGTTWGIRFSEEDLRQLAVNGQDMTYTGVIIAKNERGESTESTQPIELTIRAPVIVEATG
jgi:hypothetical protein